ncbi:MAG: hypothetical protein ACTSPJ_03720 [Candidatus Heimdallarchaeaceae archaeon]
MAKKKKIKCKKCGAEWLPNEVETKKEWNMISPMPDKDGNVTITRMASWNCPSCGKNVAGAKGKTKGEFRVEDTPKYKIEHALDSGEEVDLEELAEEIGFKVENLIKIIPAYMKKKGLKGEIKGNKFIPKK